MWEKKKPYLHPLFFLLAENQLVQAQLQIGNN